MSRLEYLEKIEEIDEDNIFELADYREAIPIATESVINIICTAIRERDSFLDRGMTYEEYINIFNNPLMLYCIRLLPERKTPKVLVPPELSRKNEGRTCSKNQACLYDILLSIFTKDRYPYDDKDDEKVLREVDKKFYSFINFIYDVYNKLFEEDMPRLYTIRETELIEVVEAYLRENDPGEPRSKNENLGQSSIGRERN